MSDLYKERLLSVQDIEGSLWVSKINPTEGLRVIRHYPHIYLPNKAKVDVLIISNKDNYEDNFSQEYLLEVYKRVL